MTRRDIPEGYRYIGYGTTRQEWVTFMARGQSYLRPPKTWLQEQDAMGRSAAKFMIWHHRYDYQKKLVIWLTSPLQDFIDAGYVTRE